MISCLKCKSAANLIAHYKAPETDAPLCAVHWEQKDEDGDLFWQIGAKVEWTQ